MSKKYITLQEASQGTPYSQEYLSLLARKGKLFSIKLGRNWYTTQEAIDEYIKKQSLTIAVPKNLFRKKEIIASLAQSLTPEDPEENSTSSKKEIHSNLIEEFKKLNPQFFGKPADKKEDAVLKTQISKTSEDLPKSPAVSPSAPVISSSGAESFKETIKTTDETEKIILSKLDKLSDSLGAFAEKITEKVMEQPENSEISETEKEFLQIESKSFIYRLQRFNHYADSLIRHPVKMFAVMISAVVLLFIIAGGFSFGQSDYLVQQVKKAFKDADTLQGYFPGTHANEVLVLDKAGNISIFGHIETQGQLRSYAPNGVAPIVVDSMTKAENLNADYLDDLDSKDFTLAFVTKNGNITYEDVLLEGNVEVGKTLTVKGAVKLLDSLQVYGKLGVFGDAVFGKDITLTSGTIHINNTQMIKNLNAEMLGGLKKNDINLDFVTSNGSATSNSISVGGLDVNGQSDFNGPGFFYEGVWGSDGAFGTLGVAGDTVIGNDDKPENSHFEVYSKKFKVDANGNVTASGKVSSALFSTTNVVSSLIPSGSYDLGSASKKWINIYGQTAHFDNLVVSGSADFSGTTSSSFKINTDNVTEDTEDSYLSFERGTTAPNATLKWNASSNRFELNEPVFIASSSTNTVFSVSGGPASISNTLFVQNNGNVGIGTTSPQAKLEITKANSTNLTDITQQGVNIIGTYEGSGGALLPGITWSTSNNLPTKTKAGIWTYLDDQSTQLRFGTTYNYTTGVNTVGLSVNTLGGVSPYARVGIGTTSPVGLLDVNTKLVVLDDGNVGIGTTGPGSILDIQAAQGAVLVTSTTGTNRAWTRYTNTGGVMEVGRERNTGGGLLTGSSGYAGIIALNSQYPIQFGTNDIVRMTITGDTGNVGIGTTNVDAKLEVSGTASVSGTTYFGSNVGIGTISPLTKLEVQGTASASHLLTTGGLQIAGGSSVSYSRFGTATTTHSGSISTINDLFISGDLEVDGAVFFDTAGGASSSFFYAQPGTAASPSFSFTIDQDTGMFRPAVNQLAFSTLGSERIRIDNGGNVGIGTTTPNAGMTLSGGGWTGFELDRRSDSAQLSSTLGFDTNGGAVFMRGETGDLVFYLDASNAIGSSMGGERLRITRTGNVGIGTTSPLTRLEIQGTASASNLLTIGGLQVAGGSSVSYSRFGSSTTSEAHYITDSSDLFISQDLEVNGSVSFAGPASISSTLYVSTLGKTGNVGIGITAPRGLLSLGNTSGTSKLLVYDAVENNQAAGLTYSPVTWGNSLFTFTHNSGELQFGKLGVDFATFTSWMTINNSGNVGIGTTSPTTKLDIIGTASVSSHFEIGDATDGSDFVIVNSWIKSHLIPFDNARNVGSAANRWSTVFADKIDANEITGASTSFSGTNEATFTINADNASADIEDMQYVYERGSPTTNAQIKWDSTNKRFDFNFPIFVQTTDPSESSYNFTKLILKGTSDQSSNDYFEIQNSNGNRLFIVETGGRLVASGSFQAGGGSVATVSYSRFGTNSTSESHYITQANDLLISGDLEVDGSVSFAGPASISSTLYVSTLGKTGNVGIGTSAPSTLLHLYSTANPILRLESSVTTESGTIAYYENGTQIGQLSFTGSFHGSAPDAAVLGTLNNSEGYISLRTGNNSEKVRIDSSGNVGIGTTSPTALTHLVGDTSTLFNVASGSNSRFIVLENGNVGIGTTSPNRTLHVVGTSSVPIKGVDSHANGSFLHLESTATNGGTWLLGPSAAAFSGAEDSFVIAEAGSTPRFVIKEGGNVGIGTVVPVAAFDIEPPSSFTGILFRIASGSNERLRVTSAGNVGIGTTSPAYFLDVSTTDANPAVRFNNGSHSYVLLNSTNSGGNSMVRFSNTADGNHEWYTGRANDGTFAILHDANTEASIDTSNNLTYNGGQAYFTGGNVGIGTTTPRSNMEVQGTNVTPGGADTRYSQNRVGQLNVVMAPGVAQAINKGGTLSLGGVTDTAGTTLNAFSSLSGRKSNSSDGNWDGYLAIETSSNASGMVERMRIDASGNVGIGTTSPTALAHIVGDVSTLFNVASGSNSRFAVLENGNVGIGTTAPSTWLDIPKGGRVAKFGLTGSLADNYVVFAGTGQDWLVGVNSGNFFGIYDTDWRLNVIQGGNVGIGTTAPIAALDVEPATTFTGPLFRVASGSNERMRITSDGLVGIGTTTPSSLLTVQGRGEIQGTASASYLLTGNTLQVGGFSSVAYSRFGTGTTSEAHYVTGSSDLFITEDLEVNGSVSFAGPASISNTLYVSTLGKTGNVGIGTTEPDHYLHIRNSGSSEFLEIESTGTDSNPHIKLTNDAQSWLVQTAGARSDNFEILKDGTTTGLVINTSGNVGIGTTGPNHKLDLRSDGSSSGIGIQVYNTGTATNDDVFTHYFTHGSREAWTGIDRSTTMYTIAGDAFAGTKNWVNVDLLNGNVGIGTTGPAAKLDVISDVIFREGLQVGHTATASYSRFGSGTTSEAHYITQANDLLISGDLEVDGSVSFAGPASISNTLYVSTLGKTGNVGIGTTTPEGILHLYKASATVQQFIQVDDLNTAQLRLGQNTDTIESLILKYDRNTNYGSLYIPVTGGILSLMEAGGNVGIGTTGPGATLHIDASAGSSLRLSRLGSGAGYLQLDADATNGYISTGGAALPLLFRINAVEKMRIHSDGNVGIGDEGSPDAALDINPTSTYTGPLFIVASGSNERLRITSAGNVGIGTTGPGNKLDVQTSIAEAFTSATPILHLYNTSSGANRGATIRFDTEPGGTTAASFISGVAISSGVSDLVFGHFTVGSYAERMRITNSGLVGIGTTSPTSLLTVQGRGEFQGTASASYLLTGNTLQVGGFASAAYSRFGIATTGHSNYISTTNDLLISGDLEVDGSISAQFASVSQMFIANNTASASIRFNSNGSGGTNQGQFSIGESIGFERLSIFNNTNSPIVTIASTGNVGIGTTGPVVTGLSAGNPILHLYGAGGGILVLERTNATTGRWEIGPNTEGNLYVISPIDSNAGVFLARAATAWSAASDERLKNIYGNIGNSLEKISTLRDVYYKFKNEDNNTARMRVGVIAQDVQAVLPEAVDVDSSGFLSIRYTDLIPLLIGGIKELNTRTEFISSNTASASMFIDSAGNIGIGTASPSYKLHVIGDIAGTSFVNISTREAKKDIEYVDETSRSSILDKLENLKIAKYHYNEEDAGSPLRLGLIAEEAPADVLAVGGKGVDIYKLATFTLAGVQELSGRVASQKTEFEILQARVASLSFTVEQLMAVRVASGSVSVSSSGVGFSEIMNTIADAAITRVQNLWATGDMIAEGARKTYFAVNNLFDWQFDLGTMASGWMTREISLAPNVDVTTQSLFSGNGAQAAGDSKLDLKENGAYLATYGVDSARGEIVLSGSSDLVGGEAKIFFDFSFTSVISPDVPLKVFITPTTFIQGQIYVSDKTPYGFVVKGLNGAVDGKFDWLVVARRKGYEGNDVASAASASATFSPTPTPLPAPSLTESPTPTPVPDTTITPTPVPVDATPTPEPTPTDIIVTPTPEPTPDATPTPTPEPVLIDPGTVVTASGSI